ncbi:PREDICTED: DNA-directed RNA polymerase III subunit RPC5-like [Nelumbo nucifera]|uniref:DNA-directed RNA polymerase III subunit RPC5-like n=1 Tax=Nelumbo nucifera TaxID=4432 RepID=A0A1U7ZS92_NELNU|nr:PREDICTED: DNA-directed RNA polymerase III subunit RPC5-like [Nelumbo nucifera]
MDLDLDDLGIERPDGSSQAASRKPSRFLPKSSKPKLRPKPEPVSESEPAALPVKKQEDSQPSLDATVKAAFEPSPPPPASSTLNFMAKEEVETKAEAEVVPMEEDGDEDRVVREIDVFFNPSPLDTDTQLYVLQYPLRPCWRPYELDERCKEVRIKPESSEIEVDLRTYDGDNCNNDDAAKNRKMTKQTLSSLWKPPNTTGYAVGVLIGNKLHLNPVHAVVQLRPSMEHLKSSNLKKSNIIPDEINEEKPSGSSKKQGKLLGSLDEQNKDDAESWVSLEYHQIDSSISRGYQQKMVARESSPIQFSMNSYDYLNSLCPGTSSDNNRVKGPSRRFLLSLPLEERFKIFLSKGTQVYRFTALKHFAPDKSDEDLLAVLQGYADLVQGLWVTKSALLCEGVQALARDYVLLCFSKGPLISYEKLNETGLSRDILKRVLNSLAIERPSFKDWKFKEPTDMLFTKNFPDIVREQQHRWEIREKKIKDLMHRPVKGGPTMKQNITNRPRTSSNADQSAKVNVNGTLGCGTVTMSDETREALPKALRELFRIHKVCSLQLICQGLRDLAVSKNNKAHARAAVAAAQGVSAPLPELQAVIDQVAINVHGVYVLKSSEEHPELDPLRNVVINLFCAKGPNACLKREEIFEAAKIALERTITPNELMKVTSELCISRSNAWFLKSGDGKP